MIGPIMGLFGLMKTKVETKNSLAKNYLYHVKILK